VQEAYVRKMIDTVNDLDNVLYEISNESDVGGLAWEKHMVDVIKAYEAGKPKRHPVGITALQGGSDADLFGSNADWISPVGRFVAGDGRKVVINDTDHSYYWTTLRADGAFQNRMWAWRTFMGGASPAFMDPYLEPWRDRNSPSGTTPDPYYETIRNAIGWTRRYADKLDLRRAVPSGSLSSTGYALAEPGAQYLVFQSGVGSFSVTLVAGTYNVEWFNTSSGATSSGGTITVASGSRSFTPPSGADLLLLKR
jgi:hypothetical protein